MTVSGDDPGPASPAPRPQPELRRRWIAAALALVLLVTVVVTALAFNRALLGAGASPSETAQPTATTSPTETPTPTPPPPPPPPPAPEPEPPRTAMNILLIGSDIRGNAREAEAQRQATGQRPDHRSDVLMLVHIPADRQRIYGISFMRDLWVNIPGYGGSKINSALEVGGVPLVTQTVGALLNAPIDHTVMVDFEGFKRLTDTLGGIEVDVKVPFTSTHDSRRPFPAGINHLDGFGALEFVRERYAFSDGDYQRVRNQQTFLRSVLAKLVKNGTAADPNAARNLIGAVAPYLIVDSGFDAGKMAWLAYSLRGLPPENAIFFTLPTAGTGFSSTGQSIVLQNPGATAAVGAALREGRIGEYVEANGLLGGN